MVCSREILPTLHFRHSIPTAARMQQTSHSLVMDKALSVQEACHLVVLATAQVLPMHIHQPHPASCLNHLSEERLRPLARHLTPPPPSMIDQEVRPRRRIHLHRLPSISHPLVTPQPAPATLLPHHHSRRHHHGTVRNLRPSVQLRLGIPPQVHLSVPPLLVVSVILHDIYFKLTFFEMSDSPSKLVFNSIVYVILTSNFIIIFFQPVSQLYIPNFQLANPPYSAAPAHMSPSSPKYSPTSPMASPSSPKYCAFFSLYLLSTNTELSPQHQPHPLIRQLVSLPYIQKFYL